MTAGEPHETCSDPMLSYYVPWSDACADPGIPLLPEAGCYEACQGPDAFCTVGACTQVPTQDVCDGDAECCGSIIELGLGDAPDTVCDQIVGTTFSSLEEIISSSVAGATSTSTSTRRRASSPGTAWSTSPRRSNEPLRHAAGVGVAFRDTAERSRPPITEDSTS